MATSLCLSRIVRSACASRNLAMGCLLINPPVPATNYATEAAVKSGGGGTHWKYERIASVALVGLIPAGFICPNPVVDYGLALTLSLHGHWGLESILEDYAHPSLKKIGYPLLYCISIGTFAGLMYLNYTDVGICNAVRMIWSLH